MEHRYNQGIHHRRSIRLTGYDYSRAGAYFVTICTKDRECLLGEMVDGTMRLNEAGLVVQSVGGNCRGVIRAWVRMHLS